jgi:hypothetical protein
MKMMSIDQVLGGGFLGRAGLLHGPDIGAEQQLSPTLMVDWTEAMPR